MKFGTKLIHNGNEIDKYTGALSIPIYQASTYHQADKGHDLARRIYSVQNGFGAVLGPQDSWLLLRGLKTLKVRMDYQQKNAQKLAEWLQRYKNVKEVFYPGLEGHEGREIHYSQADGAGAVLSLFLLNI